MPDSLELANRIYSRERQLNPLYGRLENDLSGTRYARTVQQLRSLQQRQLDIMDDLIERLEEEAPPPTGERVFAQHVLQPGETLSVLAQEYNTSVSNIRRVNPGLPEEPRPGQVVNLPIRIPEPPASSYRYIVIRGDTLYQISRRFGTNVETLVRLNNIADPDVIFPGRILIIPA